MANPQDYTELMDNPQGYTDGILYRIAEQLQRIAEQLQSIAENTQPPPPEERLAEVVTSLLGGGF
jgi:hypothetical protein